MYRQDVQTTKSQGTRTEHCIQNQTYNILANGWQSTQFCGMKSEIHECPVPWSFSLFLLWILRTEWGFPIAFTWVKAQNLNKWNFSKMSKIGTIFVKCYFGGQRPSHSVSISDTVKTSDTFCVHRNNWQTLHLDCNIPYGLFVCGMKYGNFDGSTFE